MLNIDSEALRHMFHQQIRNIKKRNCKLPKKQTKPPPENMWSDHDFCFPFKPEIGQSTVMSGAPCFPFTCGNLPVLSAPIFLCVVRSQQQTSHPGGE